jgi:hypothetical protein
MQKAPLATIFVLKALFAQIRNISSIITAIGAIYDG